MNQPPPAPPRRSRTRVIIVGAGPIGIQLAVALKQQGIVFEIVEAGAIGQTISWWAPQTRWFSSNERISIAGVPLLTDDQSKATREQYLTYLRSVVAQFDIAVRSYQPVVDIHHHNEGFTVVTQAAQGRCETDCEAIVLASGGTDFPRRLGIEGEDLPHVDGYLREPHRYYGRQVLIIGGRNSAIEAALRLHHAGAQVSICYRGEQLAEEGIKYWLLPEFRGLCEAGRINAYFGATVMQIQPGKVTLQASGPAFDVPADDVLSLIGYEQDKSLFQLAGIQLVDSCQRPEIDEQTMQSSVPGIYVAGTAIAGTQSSHYKIFLENCHAHVERIAAHLSGQVASPSKALFDPQITAHPES